MRTTARLQLSLALWTTVMGMCKYCTKAHVGVTYYYITIKLSVDLLFYDC